MYTEKKTESLPSRGEKRRARGEEKIKWRPPARCFGGEGGALALASTELREYNNSISQSYLLFSFFLFNRSRFTLNYFLLYERGEGDWGELGVSRRRDWDISLSLSITLSHVLSLLDFFSQLYARFLFFTIIVVIVIINHRVCTYSILSLSLFTYIYIYLCIYIFLSPLNCCLSKTRVHSCFNRDE